MLKSGDRLKSILKSKDVSVPSLASKMKISTQAVYDLLKRDYIKPDMRKRLSEALGVADFDLLPDTIKGEKGIPLFSVDLVSLSNKVFDGEYSATPYETICFPSVESCDFALTYYGVNMSPTIESGSLVGCKRVERTSLTFGDLFLIVTDKERLVRRVLVSSVKGTVLAVCDNDERTPEGLKVYHDLEVPVKKIEHLFAVKTVVTIKRL